MGLGCRVRTPISSNSSWILATARHFAREACMIQALLHSFVFAFNAGKEYRHYVFLKLMKRFLPELNPLGFENTRFPSLDRFALHDSMNIRFTEERIMGSDWTNDKRHLTAKRMHTISPLHMLPGPMPIYPLDVIKKHRKLQTWIFDAYLLGSPRSAFFLTVSQYAREASEAPSSIPVMYTQKWLNGSVAADLIPSSAAIHPATVVIKNACAV